MPFSPHFPAPLSDKVPAPYRIPGLGAWYDPSLLTAQSHAGAIAAWPDRSGNGNHLVQGTGAAQLTFRISALNGQPAVRTDGVDDVMTCATNVGLTGDSFTYFAVLKSLAEESGVIARVGPATNGREWGIATSPPSTQLLCKSGVGCSDTSSTALSAVLPNICVLHYDGATVTYYLNGVQDGQFAYSETFDDGGISLGTAIQVDFGDVLLFRRALPAGERRLIDRFLGRKYGVAVGGA